MALALLVSFQKQKHKSDYELAKARIFLRAKALDSKNYRAANILRDPTSVREETAKRIFKALRTETDFKD